MPSNFMDVLGMKHAAAKIVPNKCHIDIAQEMLTAFNDFSDLLQKVITSDVSLAMALKPKPNHSNGSVQKSQDQKNHVKFVQM